MTRSNGKILINLELNNMEKPCAVKYGGYNGQSQMKPGVKLQTIKIYFQLINGSR